MTTRKNYRYILGHSKRETERLRRQAKLWDPVSHAFLVSPMVVDIAGQKIK